MEGSQVIQCGTECTVTLLVSPADVSADRLADYGALFLLLLGAVVVVFLARSLVRLFWSDHGKD